MSATEAPEPMVVYCGRDFLGFGSHRADGYLAELPNGCAIGVYPSMREEARAVSTACVQADEARHA